MFLRGLTIWLTIKNGLRLGNPLCTLNGQSIDRLFVICTCQMNSAQDQLFIVRHRSLSLLTRCVSGFVSSNRWDKRLMCNCTPWMVGRWLTNIGKESWFIWVIVVFMWLFCYTTTTLSYHYYTTTMLLFTNFLLSCATGVSTQLNLRILDMHKIL